MAPGCHRLGVLSVALTTAALLAIETAPCARSSSLLSRTRLASASSTGVTWPGEPAEIGTAEIPGRVEPGADLPGGRMLGQVRQTPARPGLQLWGGITKDPGEVVIDDLPAFGRGNMWELLELVVPRFAADLIARVFRHGNDHCRRPGQDAG